MSIRKRAQCRRLTCDSPVDRAGLCHQHYEVSTYRGYVDSAPVRAHIAALNTSGMSFQSIADEAAMTPHGIYIVMSGRRVQMGTADRILRIPLGGDGLVPSLGSRRRVQALAAIGWPLAEIGSRIGATKKHVSRFIQRDRIRADKAARIKAVFDELSTVPGPSDTGRARALARGWAPPMAWDDDTIDDPDALPQHNATRQVTFAERYVEVRHHLGLTSLDEIAEKLGQDPESVKTQATRRRDDIAQLQGIAS